MKHLVQFYSEASLSPKFGNFYGTLHTVAVEDIRFTKSEGND